MKPCQHQQHFIYYIRTPSIFYRKLNHSLQTIITIQIIMDAQLATRNNLTHQRHQQLRQLIVQKKNKCREVLARNDSMIELMNMELQNLRLEFINEEIDSKPLAQSIAQNRQAICCCLIAKQDEFTLNSCEAREFQTFWVVRNTADFINKQKYLEERYQGMGSCGCDCCHKCTDLCLNEVGCVCEAEDKVASFFLTGACLFYGVFVLFAWPFLMACRCLEWCCNWGYRRGTRTSRLKQIYDRYHDQVKDIYLPE